MKLVWNSPKTTEIVKVNFLRFFVSTPLTWTRHHITSSRKRDFQSALYWWRQKAQGRGIKGAKGVPNALSLKGTWEQQCAGWRRRSSNKRPGQRPHGLENEFNNVQGKERKVGRRASRKGTERQWWRCPALVMSLTFQGYFRQCSGSPSPFVPHLDIEPDWLK